MSDEFLKKMDEYRERFDDSFPTIPLLDEGEERCIEMIDQCITANKDVVEMGFYILDDEILY